MSLLERSAKLRVRIESIRAHLMTCRGVVASQSGDHEYQASADLRQQTFHCSCPARGRMCKHILALLLAVRAEVGSDG